MSNKMKGLLKGLRYISNIFEEEEEIEMQIGFPTDVKHVAHIGWDGPTANAPSWIQKFKDGESGAAPQNGERQNGVETRGLRLPAKEKRSSTKSDVESPSKRRSDKAKGGRRRGLEESSTDSPKSTLKSTSQYRSKLAPAPDSASRDTKTSRRRKTKSSSKSKPTSTASELAYLDQGVGLT
ncbi:hypothetical protein RND81_14G134800 [Saponaria officinalis]|uniref:CRIB domain-containing protein n=1 Tax=Saponaria officinalis TaxID=3572 RepID=A0AAW1GXK7_SAPOF